MRILLMFEVVALLIVPIVLGYLRKRQLISSNQIALMVVTLFSVLMATAVLFTLEPYSPFSLPMKYWLHALGVALFFWILGYPLTRWLLRTLFDNLTIGTRDVREPPHFCGAVGNPVAFGCGEGKQRWIARGSLLVFEVCISWLQV